MIPILIPKKYATSEQSIFNWFTQLILNNSTYGVSESPLNGFKWVREPKTGRAVLMHKDYPAEEYIPLDVKESEKTILDLINAARKSDDKVTWQMVTKWISRYGDPRIRLVGYPFRLN